MGTSVRVHILSQLGHVKTIKTIPNEYLYSFLKERCRENIYKQ